jgi:hypothetical protein
MAIVTALLVSGRWITGANGNRVKLAGVNWALLKALQAIQPPTTGPGA